MEKTPFARGVPKQVKAFYEDFDLLPRELKEMLWELPYMPSMEDVKAAWELAEEKKGKDWLIATLNCFEEERKQAKRQRAEARREAAARERANRAAAKWKGRYTRIYGLRKIDHSQDKHGRLIKLVTDAEAEKLLTERKENKEVRAAVTHERVYLGTVRTDSLPEAKDPIVKPEPPVHLAKALHNAGGRPSK